MKMEFSLLVSAGNLLVISDAWLSARKRPLAECTAGKSPLAPSCQPWCRMWSMLYVHSLEIVLLSLSSRWFGKHVKMNHATWSLWYLTPKISKRQNKKWKLWSVPYTFGVYGACRETSDEWSNFFIFMNIQRESCRSLKFSHNRILLNAKLTL